MRHVGDVARLYFVALFLFSPSPSVSSLFPFFVWILRAAPDVQLVRLAGLGLFYS